jgi:spermidine synthase
MGAKRRMSWMFGVVVIAIGGIIIYYDLEQIAYESYYNDQILIETHETQYGTIAVTQSSEQLNFYENGVLLFSSDNVIANEENVHYAMLQHADPKKVLLISGGIAGTIKEILKYNIDLIDYLELDPGLIKLGYKHGGPIKDDKRIRIINKDARLFLKQTDNRYDVVLINLPDPVNARINRVYTLEFFEALKKKITPSGVVSTSISGAANYMNNDSRQLHTTLYSTMKLVFDNLLILPGHRNYFIGSDHLLSPRISELASQQGLSNQYINPHYIDDDLTAGRIIQIENNLLQKAVINYDFIPAVYLFQLKLWLSKFNANLIYFILFGAIILLLITRFNIVNQGLFVTGFSATSLELLLIISFQVIYGYVYLMMGVFITIFMGGIVLGNLYLFHKFKVNYRNYSAIQYTMGMISIIIPIVLIQINSIAATGFIIHIIFILFIGGIGLITGLQFSMATKLRNASLRVIASGTYGADSMGSAFGALITAALLIPFYGLIKVCLIIGILNFVTGLYILLRMRKKQ